MVRVSEHFRLGVSQPSLEFLDVDVEGDVRVFVDPHAFRLIDTDWANECVSLLQDFYDELLDAIRNDNRARGLELLAHAGESNEVHLGLSRGPAQGSGVGRELAADIYDALARSTTVLNGLATDLEETVLFVEGVLHDRVSDMTINIVRSELIRFTQQVCVKYGVPLTPGVESGPMWDRRTHRWTADFAELPLVPSGKLLLIPRAIVRKRGTFDPGDYLQHFVLPYMAEREMNTVGSPLVRQRSLTGRHRGALYVTKKSIAERERQLGRSVKATNSKETNENPDLLRQYRLARTGASEPPSHDDLADLTGAEEPDWDELLDAVLNVAPGAAGADQYHRAVQNLLTALLYPSLDLPQREVQIHEGRKRIDIVFVNIAVKGFFHWLENGLQIPSAWIVVECKNYTSALGNPEYDQITGRFSTRRGQFGLLLYRGYGDDKATVVRHFRDAASDGRGYVIALDDHDLREMVEARKGGDDLFEYLSTRIREII